MLQMTRLRMKLKNQSKKPLKGKRRQKCCRGRRCNFLKPTEYTGKKAAETEIPKQEKEPQESSNETKRTDEKINSNNKAPKLATRSSSR